MLTRTCRLSLAAALTAVVSPVAAHAVLREHERSPRADRLPLELSAAPANPATGQRVRLVVDSPAGAGQYRWDLAGRGYSMFTGSSPRVTAVFFTPGIHRVAVQLADPASTRTATLLVSVHPRRDTGALRHHRGQLMPGASRPRARRHQTPLRHRSADAGDPGVTIADFQFTPGTITVHVGDTVTWRNDGPRSHTATARNGSFDTGVLQKGASGSHTFTQPGAFAYYCRIHPFMHGTVVVLAATTSTSPSHASTRGSGSSATPSASTNPNSGTQQLPMTGLDVGATIFSGLLLIGFGLSLRRTLGR